MCCLKYDPDPLCLPPRPAALPRADLPRPPFAAAAGAVAKAGAEPASNGRKWLGFGC